MTKNSIYINLYDKDGNKLTTLGAKPTKQFMNFIETKMKALPDGKPFEFACYAQAINIEDTPEVLFNL